MFIMQVLASQLPFLANRNAEMGKKEEIRLEERIIKGLKETTHGYKKNETKRMISRANCNAMFLFFLTADSQILRNVHS